MRGESEQPLGTGVCLPLGYTIYNWHRWKSECSIKAPQPLFYLPRHFVNRASLFCRLTAFIFPVQPTPFPAPLLSVGKRWDWKIKRLKLGLLIGILHLLCWWWKGTVALPRTGAGHQNRTGAWQQWMLRENTALLQLGLLTNSSK